MVRDIFKVGAPVKRIKLLVPPNADPGIKFSPDGGAARGTPSTDQTAKKVPFDAGLKIYSTGVILLIEEGVGTNGLLHTEGWYGFPLKSSITGVGRTVIFPFATAGPQPVVTT